MKGDLLSLNINRLDDRANIILHEMEIMPVPGAALLGGLGLITAGWRLRKRKNT